MAGGAAIKKVGTQAADVEIIVELTEIFQAHPVEIIWIRFIHTDDFYICRL